MQFSMPYKSLVIANHWDLAIHNIWVSKTPIQVLLHKPLTKPQCDFHLVKNVKAFCLEVSKYNRLINSNMKRFTRFTFIGLIVIQINH